MPATYHVRLDVGTFLPCDANENGRFAKLRSENIECEKKDDLKFSFCQVLKFLSLSLKSTNYVVEVFSCDTYGNNDILSLLLFVSCCQSFRLFLSEFSSRCRSFRLLLLEFSSVFGGSFVASI